MNLQGFGDNDAKFPRCVNQSFALGTSQAIDKVRVAQVSNRFPTCCIADFQSADRPNLRAREIVRTACRLEALRYGPTLIRATPKAPSGIHSPRVASPSA